MRTPASFGLALLGLVSGGCLNRAGSSNVFDQTVAEPSMKEVYDLILNYAATSPRWRFHMPVCRFLIDFPLIKKEIWSEKTQNTIRPPQKLLELLFTVFFDNTSPVRAFQAL